MYLAFNAPHTPLQLPEEYYEMYKDVDVGPAVFDTTGIPFPEMSERDIDAARRVYGMITNIDENFGRLQAKLDEAGARGFVVGLSGGVDSATTAALCTRAAPGQVDQEVADAVARLVGPPPQILRIEGPEGDRDLCPVLPQVAPPICRYSIGFAVVRHLRNPYCCYVFGC